MTNFLPTGETAFAAPINSVYLDDIIIGVSGNNGGGIFNDGCCFLARVDPSAQVMVLAREGGSRALTINLGPLGYSISESGDNEKFEEQITLSFTVRDIAVDADGSLVALSQDGQVFRALSGGTFEPVRVAAGDTNNDGFADIITNGILIGGNGQGGIFVAGQRTDPATGATMATLLRLGDDGLVPFSSWNFENGWPSRGTVTGFLMGDGSVLFAIGTDLFQIDPAGTARKVPLVGDDVGALVGDEIGAVLLFNDPNVINPSFVRIDASTPKLQEFKLSLR